MKVEWLPVAQIREGIRDQICPWCGRGPFKVLAKHTNSVHDVDREMLGDMAEFRRGASLCDPVYSEQCAARAPTPPSPPLAAAAAVLRRHSEGLTVMERRNREKRTRDALIAREIKVKAHAEYLVTLNNRRRDVLKAGPHDERNYRCGCRCSECKAAHSEAQRIYRSTGRFPSIRDSVLPRAYRVFTS